MTDNVILILANGEWRGEECLREVVSSANTIVATDGAWAKAHDRGIKVDLVIGDADSLTETELAALRSSSVEMLTYPREKDWTDLELAVDCALSQNPDRIIVYGALGGRSDHLLANIFLLEKGVVAKIPIEIIDGAERIFFLSDRCEIPDAQIGDRVSLLALTERATIRTTGLKYSLNGEPLNRASSKGISNEIASCPVRLKVEDGLLLVVHAKCGLHEEGC